jgi:hypothetical protein
MRTTFTVYFLLVVAVPLLGIAAPKATSKAETLAVEIRENQADATSILSMRKIHGRSQSSEEAELTIDELEVARMVLENRIADLRSHSCRGNRTPERIKHDQQVDRIDVLMAEIIKLRLEKAIILWQMKQNSPFLTNTTDTQQPLPQVQK